MTATSVPSSPAPVVFGDPKLHTDGDLLALTFDEEGDLWSVEEPGMIRHWDAETGQQIGCLSLSDLETLWRFSPNGRLLASASDDLALWDVASGQFLAGIPQPSWVTALAFSSDGTLLATGHDDGVVRCWDLRGQRLLRTFAIHRQAVSALAFQPDGKQLAASGEDKIIYVWDTATAQLMGTLAGHTDRIPALAWHPQGRLLVSGAWDAMARVWDLQSFQPVFLFNSHATQVTALAFSADGVFLASADAGGRMDVWEFGKYRALHAWQTDGQEIGCLAFSPDNHYLAAGGGGRVIRLGNIRTGQILSGADRPDGAPTIVAVSPDGGRLVSTGQQALRIWDTTVVQRGAVSNPPDAQIAFAGAINTVAYSPDGRWLATGGADALIRLCDAETGEERALLEGGEEPATALAFSPDGSKIASAGCTGAAVLVWDVATAEPILLIPDALDGCTVNALAFFPHGNLLAVGGIDWLATGGSDGATCLWDIGEQCEVATFAGGTTCVAVHPSGRWLATASLVRSICIWDVPTQQLLAELTGPEDTIRGLAWSPDGHWLACGGSDRTLHIWSVMDGLPVEESMVAVPLDTQIHSLCFAPDSQFLFTGNGNTTCYRVEVRSLVSGEYNETRA